jgi:hypothetical protein
MLADLKMPGSLEAVDGILSDIDTPNLVDIARRFTGRGLRDEAVKPVFGDTSAFFAHSLQKMRTISGATASSCCSPESRIGSFRQIAAMSSALQQGLSEAERLAARLTATQIPARSPSPDLLSPPASPRSSSPRRGRTPSRCA